MYVYAFQPRRYDLPQHVADDREALIDLVGSLISGNQCDGCGNCAYLVVRESENVFRAVCTDDPDDEFSHHQPCGGKYGIVLKDEDEVEF